MIESDKYEIMRLAGMLALDKAENALNALHGTERTELQDMAAWKELEFLMEELIK